MSTLESTALGGNVSHSVSDKLSDMAGSAVTALPSLGLYRTVVQVLVAQQRALTPVYVDIGAEHPTSDSLTQMLYERGWRGVNVEPVPAYLHYLKNQRAEDQNLPNLPLAAALEYAHGGLLRLHLSRGVTAQDVVTLAWSQINHRPALVCIEDSASQLAHNAPWMDALRQAGFVQSCLKDSVSIWVQASMTLLQQALSRAVTTDDAVVARQDIAPNHVPKQEQATQPQQASIATSTVLLRPAQPTNLAQPTHDARQLLRRRLVAMLKEGRVGAVVKSRVRRLAVAAVRRGLLTNAAGLALMAQLERIPRLRPYVQRLTRSQQGLTPVSSQLLQQMKAAIATMPSSPPQSSPAVSRRSPNTSSAPSASPSSSAH